MPYAANHTTKFLSAIISTSNICVHSCLRGSRRFTCEINTIDPRTHRLRRASLNTSRSRDLLLCLLALLRWDWLLSRDRDREVRRFLCLLLCLWRVCDLLRLLDRPMLLHWWMKDCTAKKLSRSHSACASHCKWPTLLLRCVRMRGVNQSACIDYGAPFGTSPVKNRMLTH